MADEPDAGPRYDRVYFLVDEHGNARLPMIDQARAVKLATAFEEIMIGVDIMYLYDGRPGRG